MRSELEGRWVRTQDVLSLCESVSYLGFSVVLAYRTMGGGVSTVTAELTAEAGDKYRAFAI